MKKMTVTELNALTDYVVESVLASKRDEVKKSVSTISENELNELLARAEKLVKAKNDAYNALEEAKERLNEFEKGLFDKNFNGRYVYVDGYYSSTTKIQEYNDDTLFKGTKFEPWILRKDVERKLVLKNLGSEVDVESFIKELVASY